MLIHHGEETAAVCDPVPVFQGGDDRSINKNAVYSTLQLGTIVPPLGPFDGQVRTRPGHQRSGAEGDEPSHVFGRLHGRSNGPHPTLEDQASAVEAFLDHSLSAVETPVLLFSGGVDSGLLASRFCALGKKPLLVHYSFSENDPETVVARLMADELGLHMECIVAGDESPYRCLEDNGELYPMPFVDRSTIPTSALARAVEPLCPPGATLVDGTGADGGFGTAARVRQWIRAGRIPRPLRRLAACLYPSVGLSCSRVERSLRLVRKSASMPLSSAVLGQNAYARILYREPPQSQDVHSALASWIGPLANGDRLAEVVLADLALTCSNVFLQKSSPLFRRMGLPVCLPFMTTEACELACAAVHWAPAAPKAALKLSLSRWVDPALVYRPKAGFTDPTDELYREPEYRQFLLEALDGPIGPMLISRGVRSAVRAIDRGTMIPQPLQTTLWGIVFTDRWYRTHRGIGSAVA